jgi:myo-inositol-1-phosphate synthase
MSPVSISDHYDHSAQPTTKSTNGNATASNQFSTTNLPVDPTAARRPIEPITVDTPNLVYTAEALLAKYTFHSTEVKRVGERFEVKPTEKSLQFKTDRKVPKTG